MTPGARVQAAIELTGEIGADSPAQGPPADRVIRAYFKKRRYAGSKDRAAIIDLTYDVLRRRARLLWLVGDGAVTDRALMLACLSNLRGEDDDGLTQIFSGQGHAPAPLDATERVLAQRLAALPADPPDMPDWARLDYPEWMDGALRARFGAGLEPEIAALNGRAATDIRVNSLKTTRAEVAQALAEESLSSAACRWSPMGLRVTGRARLDSLAAYRDGGFEVQDRGAQVVSLLTDARPGMQVVDLCAGAGGKSLALAAAMKGKGQIHAFDRDGGRLRALNARLQRAGAFNIQIAGPARGDKFESLIGKARRVLVDAPCAGSGIWRRSPDLKWRYRADAIETFAGRQRDLLDRGARLVAPGGRLIYVTCSLLEAENEEPVRAFAAGHPDFKLLPYKQAWRATIGGAPPKTLSSLPECLQFSPHSHGCDGFFIAIFEKLVMDSQEARR